MAEFFKGLLLSVLTEKCYEEYFEKFNFLDGNFVLDICLTGSVLICVGWPDNAFCSFGFSEF